MNEPRTKHPFAASALLGALLLGACAAPPCPPPAAPAPPPPPPPAAPPPVVQPVVHVSPDPAPPQPSMLRSLPELPRPSPEAEVRQRVGITDVAVSYSSPGAKGRKIWGEVVPFGEVWRTGANASTRLTVSRDFTFGDKPVPAGRYSIFSIPTASKWTVILNKDPDGAGASKHDTKHDVARVEVLAADVPARERLTFLFEDTTDDATKLVLDWAGKRLVVPLAVKTKEHAEKSIAATLENAWRPLFNAGRYAFDQGDHARAATLLEQSIGVHGTWWNHWWLAQALAKQKKNAAARQHAQKALEMGKDDDTFKRFFAEDVNKALKDWPES